MSVALGAEYKFITSVSFRFKGKVQEDIELDTVGIAIVVAIVVE